PAWSPPDMIKRENPRIPDVIPSGSPANPMGEAAITLSGGGQYAIHGTNNPGSVGRFVSHGCFRMYNNDVMDLYNRVSWGTPVVVLCVPGASKGFENELSRRPFNSGRRRCDRRHGFAGLGMVAI